MHSTLYSLTVPTVHSTTDTVSTTHLVSHLSLSHCSHSKTELAAVNSARGVTSSVATKYIAVPDSIKVQGLKGSGSASGSGSGSGSG